MRHCLIYQGAFELNYPALRVGAASYVSTEGATKQLAAPPPSVTGLVIGYMERAGKKFSVVRVRFEDHDVVVRNPVVIEPMRHLGGKRFSARPIIVDDEHVSVLLDDVIAQNPGQQSELALILNRVNHVRRGERESIE